MASLPSHPSLFRQRNFSALLWGQLVSLVAWGSSGRDVFAVSTDGIIRHYVGRGSSIEAFPLFGFDLEDYDSLFEEKLDLLL